MSENQNPSQLNLALPKSLATIVHAALMAGLDEVSVGLEGLGADFPAPIGWIVHLNLYDPSYEYQLEQAGRLPEGEHHLVIDYRPDGEPVEAYTPEGYLDFTQIIAWINEPRPSLAGPNISITDAEQKYFFHDAELMLKAVSNGWEVQRTLNRSEAHHLCQRLVETGKLPPEGNLLPNANLSFGALNWNYNTENHPSHHSTGADLSKTVTLLKHYKLGTETRVNFYSAVNSVPIDYALCLEMVSSTAPYAVPMARYDEENEDWVL